MMRNTCKIVGNQRGSIINVALLILILIFLIGMGLHKISTTDVKIATNLKTQTTTFYGAEAGLEGASEVLEQNLACPTGFRDATDSSTDGLPPLWENIEGVVVVTNLDFWRNDPDDAGDPENGNLAAVIAGTATVLDSPIDAYYPPDYDGSDNVEHTNVSIGGVTRYAKGSAIQMAAGYEGLGHGSAAGGATMAFDIFVRRYGADGSQALHTIQWIHKLGLGGTCNY